MKIIDFSRLAWMSANSYYNYLKASDKCGKSVVNFRSIHPISANKFTMFLSKKVPYIDSAVIKIISYDHLFEYDESELKIVEYNELSSYIFVIASDRVSNILNITPIENITLESDLTFLVKSVREWYEKYHDKISYPPAPIQGINLSRPMEISDEQYEAVCSALSSPISYIWGAPGTGKTQMVLANCILKYAETDEHVIIMAPTNNALEQSLRGIISVLDKKGIERRKIIRLGRATSQFLVQYPELCEAGYYDSLVDTLKQEIERLKAVCEKQKKIESFAAYYQEYKCLIDDYNLISNYKEEYSKKGYVLNKELSDIQEEIAKRQDEKTKCQGLLNEYEHHLELQNRYEVFIKNYDEYRTIVDKYALSVKKLSDELVKHREELFSVTAKIDGTKNEYLALKQELAIHCKQRGSLGFKIRSLISRELKSEIETRIYELQKKSESIYKILSAEEILKEKIESCIDAVEKEIEKERLLRNGSPKLLEISQNVFGCYYTYSDLEDALEQKLSEYKDFKYDNIIEEKVVTTKKELDFVKSNLDETIIRAEQVKNEISEVMAKESQHSAQLLEKRCQIAKVSIDCWGADHSLEKLDELFAARHEEYKSFSEIGNAEELISEKEKEYQNIMVQLKDMLSERTIVACTVDYATIHYDKFTEGIAGNAAHLFVDEAAYCSLIKAGVFFSFGIPVTFFGDHMQLPPICEMERQAILSCEDNQKILLWDMSAIHFPDVFEESLGFDGIMNVYMANLSPDFTNVNVSFLKKTFRFGENIAKVLDEFVYHQGFQGDINAKTEIIVIDAPRGNSELEKTESESEVQVIKDFLNGSEVTDYAVLTPYRKQRALIEKMMHLPAEKVLTIHSAQGREWDTVIVSVVDAKWKFFMSSKNKKSNGLRIVNTAISRAKKRLVLVLDWNCWEHCRNELITEIAKIGNKTNGI